MISPPTTAVRSASLPRACFPAALLGRQASEPEGRSVAYNADVFDEALIELAAREKEVELTTFGRKTGKASRRIIWITALNGKLYVRSGLGLTRDWPQNLLANGRAMLHIAGQDIPVRARHVTDPVEARAMHAPVKAKYDAERPASKEGEPLTPSEQAVFELLPAAV